MQDETTRAERYTTLGNTSTIRDNTSTTRRNTRQHKCNTRKHEHKTRHHECNTSTKQHKIYFDLFIFLPVWNFLRENFLVNVSGITVILILFSDFFTCELFSGKKFQRGNKLVRKKKVNKSCWIPVKKCWCQQNSGSLSRHLYIFWSFLDKV